jgi:A/G-specific adenine glycosylase
VVSRLFAVEDPMPDAKPELRGLAALIADARRPGDWAQATMDLGAVICRPKAPLCDRCPVSGFCAARDRQPETYPRKRAKADRPRRYGVAYVLTRKGAVARVRRPDKGLLGGMLALPTSEWRSSRFDATEAAASAPLPAAWRSAGEVEHVFTHFALTLTVLRAEVTGDLAGADWARAEAAGEGLPTVFLKALRAGLSSLL